MSQGSTLNAYNKSKRLKPLPKQGIFSLNRSVRQLRHSETLDILD